MKKFILTSVFLMCITLGLAQVNTYQFSQSNGVYTSISDGTLVASATATNTYDTEGWSVQLPFSFNFDQQPYQSVYVNSNGGLTFGGVNNSSTLISYNSTDYQGAIAVMNRDLWGVFYTTGTATNGSTVVTNIGSFEGLTVGTTLRNSGGIATGTTVTAINPETNSITISSPATSNSTNGISWGIGKIYTKTIGESPNRKFVIEWNNFSDYTSTASGSNRFTFQVQLEESTNKIYFVYGDFSNIIATTSRTNEIGLRGVNNQDFNNRTSSTSWTNTTSGTTNNATVTRTNTILPTSGLTYIWSPPTCFKPNVIETSNITLNSFSFTWQAPSSVPENGYEWEVRIDDNPGTPGAIQSGTTTSINAITVENLSSFTQYKIFVRSVCDSNTYSVWSNVKNVTTLLPITLLPHSDNFETVSNSWGFVNGTQKNKWFIGEAVNNGGNKSMYISDHATGQTHNYTLSGTGATSSVSAIKDLQIPNDASNISISFDWKAYGEGVGTSYYDYLSVWITPITFTPQAGTNISASTDRILLGRYKLNASWSNENILFDSSSYAGQNLRLIFEWRNDSGGGTQPPAAIDNLSITKITCVDPSNLVSNQISKNTVSFSWAASSSLTLLGYEYEIRTSGLPGTTNGLVSSGTLGNVLTASVQNLQPSTDYLIYVRTICSESNYSEWISTEFTTLCNYPDLIEIITNSVCGIGTTNLSANVNGSGLVEWFSSPTSNQRLHIGTNFETPEINQTTSFYVGSSVVSDDVQVTVGDGLGTSATYSNPFYTSWSNIHTQHIITAEELSNFGLQAGPISAVGLNVTNAGTLPMLNFSLKIGTTTANTLVDFVANDAFVTVNTAASFMPVTGINMMQFDQPYLWDGTSNIVLEFCHYNPASTATINRTVTSDTTSYLSSIKTHVTALADSPEICGNVSSNKVSYSVRPQFIFEGKGLCRSPKQEVIVEVNPATPVVLSTNTISDVCQGNDSSLVTIVSGGANYDTYEWVPSEGVFGNAEQGFYFNIHQDAVYTLKAMNSETGCRYDQQVSLFVNLVGYTPLVEEVASCGNEAIELDVTASGSFVTIPQGEILGSYGFNSLENSGWVHNNLTGTTTVAQANGLDALGNGYIRFSHSTSSTGNITFNDTFNAENSNGLIVEFRHMSILEGSTYDYGFVEYSLDNGVTWNTFNSSHYVGTAIGLADVSFKRFAKSSYQDWSSFANAEIPNQSKWKNEKFVLYNNEALDLSNVKVRMSLKSDTSNNYYGWLIDDVKISTIGSLNYSWNSELPIYVDQQATQLYNGESIAKVYVKPTQSGDIPVHVTVSNGTCNSTDTVMIHVPEIVIPDFSGEQYCQAVSVSEMTFERTEGHSYVWYNSAFSQVALESIPFTGTYYVQISNEGCTSERIAVPVVIVGNVVLNVQTTQKFCDAATVADLVALGSSNSAQVNWYASATSETPLAANTLLVNNTTYYVSQNLYGCETQRVAVLVKIFDTPQMLQTNQINVCYNSLVGNVVIDGNTQLKWYTSLNGTTVLSQNHVLTSGTYFISNSNDICESERVQVTVTVIENLPIVSTTLIDICGSGFVQDLDGYVSNVVPGAELKWYASSTSTSPLSPTSVLNSGTYYVEQKLSDCSSVRRAVAVRVTSKVAPVINSQTVCQGTQIRDIFIPGASSVTYKWYATPTSEVELNPNQVLTTGMYYIKRVQFGCVSNAAQVFVDVRALPSAPTGALFQELEEGSTVADIVMDQSNIVWYINQQDALIGENPLDVNMPLVSGQTYYAVTINESGCASTTTAVTINLYLGINDLDISKLNVYPNPTESVVTISYNETIDRVEVYSLLGQKVIDQKASSDEVQLDLTNLSSGTYMIKISVGNDNQLVKIVKK